MPSITRKISPLSVGDLFNRYSNGQLNAEPGFKHQSVLGNDHSLYLA